MDFQSLGPLLQYLAELVAEDVLAGPRLDITGATTQNGRNAPHRRDLRQVLDGQTAGDLARAAHKCRRSSAETDRRFAGHLVTLSEAGRRPAKRVSAGLGESPHDTTRLDCANPPRRG